MADLLAVVFPGQGSQVCGMGAALFDQVEIFRRNESRIDAILGWSVREVCLHDPRQELSRTQFTQPCLYIVNALHWYQAQADGLGPCWLAGHSLGEYNALLAAGAFDLLTGLELVKRRGELMSQAAAGSMSAVLNLAQDRIAEVLAQHGITSLDLANQNSDAQAVLAGPKEDLDRAALLLTQAGARACVPLAVSAAFHSRYMQPAAQAFDRFLSDVDIRPIQLPVIANATALPYPEGASADDVRSLLVRQITEPVRWTASVRALLAAGVTEFRELGPGSVLSRLVQQIRAATPAKPAAAAPALVSAPESSAAATSVAASHVVAQRLGSAAFRRDFGLRLAYMSGAMYKGIASKELVVAMGRAGLMGFFGTGGVALEQVERSVAHIQSELGAQGRFGVNLLADIAHPAHEAAMVDMFLRRGVRVIEAAAYMQVSIDLVRYRLAGVHRAGDGRVVAPNRIIAKVSRPEVAQAFMSPPPQTLIDKLLGAGVIDTQQAALAASVPMAQDICVEADSGGHSDQGVAYALMPAMQALRDEMMRRHRFADGLRVGAAGGIGTPEAAAAAFVLGAEFVVTGSINQCTVEAGTSEAVKDLLQDMNVQDTDYAPAGDMFELGARIQVLRKGVFFPARAKRLYELYQRHERLEDIHAETRSQIEQRYFKRSFEAVWDETRAHYQRAWPAVLDNIEQHPKRKMALVFRWYFMHSTRLALQGDPEQRVDYQVQCGPALGAFNQWVKGTPLENWRQRRVADIAERIMAGAAAVLEQRFAAMQAGA